MHGVPWPCDGKMQGGHDESCPYRTRGEERSLDYARDDKLGERLVDEVEAVGNELGEDVGVQHHYDTDDAG
jgi:hypothetical protein